MIGSDDSYIRTILSRACASVEEGGLGYRAAVIIFRGCTSSYTYIIGFFFLLPYFCIGDGVPLTSQLLYSAGHTDDTRQALMYITHRYPKALLLGLGFSLGANVLTRYLGEEGAQSRLSSGCVLACVCLLT